MGDTLSPSVQRRRHLTAPAQAPTQAAEAIEGRQSAYFDIMLNCFGRDVSYKGTQSHRALHLEESQQALE